MAVDRRQQRCVDLLALPDPVAAFRGVVSGVSREARAVNAGVGALLSAHAVDPSEPYSPLAEFRRRAAAVCASPAETSAPPAAHFPHIDRAFALLAKRLKRPFLATASAHARTAVSNDWTMTRKQRSDEQSHSDECSSGERQSVRQGSGAGTARSTPSEREEWSSGLGGVQSAHDDAAQQFGTPECAHVDATRTEYSHHDGSIEQSRSGANQQREVAESEQAAVWLHNRTAVSGLHLTLTSVTATRDAHTGMHSDRAGLSLTSRSSRSPALDVCATVCLAPAGRCIRRVAPGSEATVSGTATACVDWKS